MNYRTTLTSEQINFVKRVWSNGGGNIDKKNTAIQMIKCFDTLSEYSVNAIRKRIEHLCKQFVQENERGESMNEFIEGQNMVGRNMERTWTRVYDENGKHLATHQHKNPQIEQELEDLKATIIEEMKEYAPVYPKIKREKSKDGHLLVIDPADIHIGKLASSFENGEDYDRQIAVQRVHEGVQGILDKTSGYNIDKILFIGGNDILHIDTPKSSTTSGTSQDTDGMRYDNFLIAKRLYVEVLEKLISIADVHFVYNPSNHDYMSGFFLCDAIASRFHNNKNISFDVSIAHRKYYNYYDNLIGSTHGDGAKQNDLPLLMAQESKERSNTKHRYIYTHHVHHKTSKDFIGVTVESLRSASGTDSRHHRNGYQHAPKAIEGFLHHKQYGQIARITHLF